MKKIWGILAILTISGGILAGTAFAVDNSKSPFVDETTAAEADDVNVLGSKEQQKDAGVNVVKGVVNRVLGILALIALLFLLRGGFQMVTSGGDDGKYKAGYTILQHAIIGLLLIGVARFIVSIVFRLVNKVATDPGTANTQT